jgi:hypothetical protein
MPLQVDKIEDHQALETGSEERPRVLVCVPRYLPGYKSGGPIRSVSNMIGYLASKYEFFVVTRDRDASDKVTYPGIQPGVWHRVSGAQVLYCSSIGREVLRRAYRDVQPSAIVLNSFHDTFTRVMLLLRRAGVFGRTPIILAPRGEFSPGAMQIKSWKKRLYRLATRTIGFHEDLLWQVSSAREKLELLQAAPARRIDERCVFVAQNVSDPLPAAAQHPPKAAGAVKFVFISRVTEMKNLRFLLDILPELHGTVQLSVYGPVAEKDAVYWKRCKEFLDKLPANISAKYYGPIDHSAVSRVLHEHHFFVLPTKGENFCHSAVESLINGIPVLLSDQTPWTNLRNTYAGFDITLDDRNAWISTLQACIDMGQEVYSNYLRGALEYGRRFSPEEAVREQLALFDAALHLSS